MKTLHEIKKEIEANLEVKRANDAEREKAKNAFIAAHKAHDRDAAGLASLEIEKLQKAAERKSARIKRNRGRGFEMARLTAQPVAAGIKRV